MQKTYQKYTNVDKPGANQKAKETLEELEVGERCNFKKRNPKWRQDTENDGSSGQERAGTNALAAAGTAVSSTLVGKKSTKKARAAAEAREANRKGAQLKAKTNIGMEEEEFYSKGVTKGVIVFAKDEDIRTLDMRDANPEERRVAAKVVAVKTSGIFGLVLEGKKILEKRYSVEFTLDVKLNNMLRVRIHGGEHAGRDGQQLNETDTNSLISMTESKQGVQKRNGNDGGDDDEQEEQQIELEVQLDSRDSKASAILAVGNEVMSQHGGQGSGVGETVKVCATDLEVLSPIEKLQVVGQHLQRTFIVEDLSINQLAAYTEDKLVDKYELQLHNAIKGLPDDAARKNRLIELVAFDNWKGVLLATKKSLIKLAIQFDSSGALDFILEMPARDSFDSSMWIHNSESRDQYLDQISPEKLVKEAIQQRATSVLCLLVKQKMMAIPFSDCKFDKICNDTLDSAKKAVRGEVEIGKIQFLDTIVKMIAEQQPAKYANTICSQFSQLERDNFLARSAVFPDLRALQVCLEPFSKLAYLALNGENENSLLHFFALLGGDGRAGFEGYKRLADNDLLRAGLFHREKQGNLPLHLLCGKNRPGKGDAKLALARTFLELEPRAALAKNGDGNTPLHLAAMAQWVDMAKLILDFVGQALPSRDLDSENTASETALQLATSKGHSALIKVLLEAGWYSTHTLYSCTLLIHPTHTLHSYTPLIHSSHTLLSYTPLSYTPLIHSSRTLLSYTPLIHSTPLSDPYYSSNGKCESSLFIALHREIAIKSTGFESVLREALLAGNIDLTRYPLHAVVCSSNALQLLQDCLGAGMCPDTHRVGSKAPLHLVRDGNLAKLLLDAGANFRLRDELGNTPLHYACARNYEGVTKLLIERGAKYGHEVENHENRTPQDCAIGASREYIVRLIRRKNVQRAERLKAQTQADSSMKDVEGKSVAQLVLFLEDMIKVMPVQEYEVSTAPADRRRSLTKSQSRSNPLLSELRFNGQPREVHLSPAVLESMFHMRLEPRILLLRKLLSLVECEPKSVSVSLKQPVDTSARAYTPYSQFAEFSPRGCSDTYCRCAGSPSRKKLKVSGLQVQPVQTV
jgi:ankyrin repeat protein